jgi:SAM-dependent methyltransferase
MKQYQTEFGTIIGNIDAKYYTRNPFARALMNGFLSDFDNLVLRSGSQAVHEIGCGEGHLSARLADLGLTVRSSDFSRDIIAKASDLNAGRGIDFTVRSIYDLNRDEDRAPLVVCCEVLEHLLDPERGLNCLAAIAEEFCILSVPREPLWRALNMLRWRYLSDLGNTPGHFQHWNKRRFMTLVSRYFNIVEVRSPLPWTMILCRAKSQ